jgi:signal peptide peptidase SppA
MTLLELITGCWAIEPDKLREIQAIYATHMRGERIDVAAIEARLGRPLHAEQQAYSVEQGGVAVLRASGVMAPKANLFMQVSGGISTQMLTKQLESAAVDARVRATVLAMDTPGGNVLGVPEFAATIFALSQQKPIVIHSDGALASAGYWSGAAANAIYISGPVVQVGSIGVVVSRNFNPNASSKEEHIVAGKYKRLAKSNEPLSEESRAVVQADVDYVYSLFVDDVAKFRGATSEQVLEHMADGRVFRGQQAIDAGLVDGVATLDALVEQMATDPSQFSTRRKARFVGGKGGAKQSTGAGAAQEDDLSATNQGNPDMETNVTRESLQKDHAPLYAALQAEFTALGATQERERQAAVRATLVPGHEALVETLANDGKTTAAEAALAVNTAVRAAHTAAARQHADDAPAAVRSSAAPADKPTKTKQEQVVEAQAHAKAKNIDLVDALKELGYAR